MRLTDEDLRGLTVIAADGLAIGSIAAFNLDSDGWRVESLKVTLHKDVADRIGADRSWLRSGVIEIPTQMVQSVGDAVVLAVALDELRQVLPSTAEPEPAR